MQLFELLANGLIFRLIETIVLPLLLILAARHLWHCASDWIVIFIVVFAAVRFLSSSFYLLFTPVFGDLIGGFDAQKWVLITTPIRILNWATGLMFGIAILSLAQEFRNAVSRLPASSNTAPPSG